MQTSMIEKAIEFYNVYYTDSDLHIIKGTNGYIAKGKITTLVGPSGAGKTTIFKLINGLISPTKGEIYSKVNISIHLNQQFTPLHRTSFTRSDNALRYRF